MRGDATTVVETEALPSLENIIPHDPNTKSEGLFSSSSTAKCLAEFKAKYGIPNKVDVVPASGDEVYTRLLEYSALYAYPLVIDYYFPLPLLVKEFYHHNRVCPA